MDLVLRIGGHVIFSDSINLDLLKNYTSMLSEVYDGESKWVVVVGGGRLARVYTDVARKLGVPETVIDEIGIMVTRVNASLLMHAMKDVAYQSIPATLEDVRKFLANRKIVVMGGLQPGHSTIATAAIVCDAIGAKKLIIATDVEGIYTSDPKHDPKAKLITRITVNELKKMFKETPQIAGGYELVDLVGLNMIERSRIECIYVNGNDVEKVRKALMGEHVGTLVTPY